MLKEIVIAIEGYFQAYQFMLKNKLWKWIIIPGIIYAILFAVSMYFFGSSANNFIEWILQKTHLNSWLQKIDSGLLAFLLTFDAMILWMVLMMFYFSLFKYLWLILGSPVFAYLSEKTEADMEGRELEFNTKKFWKDIRRGCFIALRNALWQTVYTISILILALIPIAGWISPLVAILVECYYYGFSMLDYSAGRRNMNTSESFYFISMHKGLAIGNGLVFYLLHVIPFLGWILAPAYAIIAATLSMIKVKGAAAVQETTPVSVE